jgi:hypothetical protein
MMEVAAYHTPPATPDQDALLAGLSDERAAAIVVDQPYLDWAFRLDPVVAQLVAGGFWDQPKPWLTLFLPGSTAAGTVESLLAQLAPDQMGVGPASLYPIDTTTIARPFFALPDEPVAFQLNLLRFPFPGYPDIPGLLAQNRAFYDEAVASGGTRYVIGAVPDMTESDWKRHFGARWDAFARAKRRFDPDGVLTPGQGIFPPP